MKAAIHSDVLIIGCGIAGGTAALELADAGLDVVIVTRAATPAESNTYWAQGGIIFRGDGDSPEKLTEDVLHAGAGICREQAVALLAREGPNLVQSLLIDRLKVPFDRRPDGTLALGREVGDRMAHCVQRVGRTVDGDEDLEHGLASFGNRVSIWQRGGRTCADRALDGELGKPGMDARLEAAMILHEPQPQYHRDGDQQAVGEQRRAREPGDEHGLVRDHLHRGPDEHPRADVDHARKAVDEAQHQRAAPDDDRHADGEADDHEQVAAVRCAGDGEHVVQAHHGVGDDDRVHRAPERRHRGFAMAVLALLGQQQAIGDPDQHQATGEQQAGDLEQPDDDHRHQAAHGDGADRAPDDRAPLQQWRQRARRQRDDHGVVAREHDVDHDDREQRREKL